MDSVVGGEIETRVATIFRETQLYQYYWTLLNTESVNWLNIEVTEIEQSLKPLSNRALQFSWLICSIKMLTCSTERVLEIVEQVTLASYFSIHGILMYSGYVNNKTEQHQKNCVALQILLF